MGQSQAVRARLLEPFLKWITCCRLSANHFTLLSLFAGLFFCPVFMWGSKPVAFSLLFLHVLLDGVDGPLARYQQRASNRGSFTDTMTDQVIVIFTAITMIATGYAGAWPGGLYISFYCIVVFFAMVRSALAIPYSWIVRPRFIVYLWFPLEVYLWRGSLDHILWLCSLVLGIKMLTGFVRIRRSI